MEIDNPKKRNSSKKTKTKNENSFNLYPVSQWSSGEGLPYAPINWPNPGDNWAWKVGKRVARSGFFLDRYLYVPTSLCEGRARKNFASKLSVEDYIRTKFPNADINAFFDSFSWKVLADHQCERTDTEEGAKIPTDDTTKDSASDLKCKAGNKNCISLTESSKESSPSDSITMPCDICCSEPNFCIHCSCILCCRPINSPYRSFESIRCESVTVDGFVCRHVAHIDCGVRSYMAGTVGGTIGLDAEYYCRRCDMKTDLVPHVWNLLQMCESDFKSRDDVEKILDIGVRLLRGSRRAGAKTLLQRVEFVLEKLDSGVNLEDIWKLGDISSLTAGVASQNRNNALEAANKMDPPDRKPDPIPTMFSGSFDHRIESLKLEDEIDQILMSLKKSQQTEYNIAEERLYAQKNYLLNLYEQLDEERSELKLKALSTNSSEVLIDATLSRVDQIKREVMKLRDMEEVAKGFGRTSKAILKEHFGLEVELEKKEIVFNGLCSNFD